ncbi:hypothetical protein MPTK1_8g02260 [Marchantia polymorpha subsp. ruderalis]|uniref:Uncharacterized protein n=1 Tax=Marchantia polymorpha TaxID=3197 RepID=A0A2R6XIW4_MARPO|nr:hypothetical protein MARPO_0012s0023 [Marchantia polymorpha]BBN18413.1 hypothetical protein Mp_8g02260 [Marchantia polymorpha subsp. ruderalis]|eukprot:PTQ46060.1 hypothetical protein MARPO_0012s0023 [Marchantia polymorpha]
MAVLEVERCCYPDPTGGGSGEPSVRLGTKTRDGAAARIKIKRGLNIQAFPGEKSDMWQKRGWSRTQAGRRSVQSFGSPESPLPLPTCLPSNCSGQLPVACSSAKGHVCLPLMRAPAQRQVKECSTLVFLHPHPSPRFFKAVLDQGFFPPLASSSLVFLYHQ